MDALGTDKLTEVAQRLTAAAIKRFRTDVVAEIDTQMETLLQEFRDHVVHQSWLSAQKWCRWENDKFVLFPDFTRIYYRKGNKEVMVQEYPPQVRLVSFKERLTNYATATHAAELGRLADGEKTYTLALPYTIFVFAFQDGMFSEVYVGFTDRPLKDCHEPIYRPYLSNINTCLRLCLGDMDYTKLIKGNVSQQAAYILSHFWQTAYSDEWSTHYWANKAHFQQIDPRLATLEAWQDASIDNPLFVIEDVDWLPYLNEDLHVTQVGDLVSHIFDSERKDSEFSQDTYRKIYNVFEDQIRKTIIDQLHNFEVKMSPQVTEKIVEEMSALFHIGV